MQNKPNQMPGADAQSTDFGVLDTIKKQKGDTGGGPQMNTLDVIKKAMNTSLPEGITMDEFMKKLATLLKDKNKRLVQVGNSVFLLTNMGDGAVEVHTFSAETPQGLIKNYVGLAKMLKNFGIKKAVTYADQPGFQEIAEKTGLNIKTSQGSKVIGGQAKPVYTFEVEL